MSYGKHWPYFFCYHFRKKNIYLCQPDANLAPQILNIPDNTPICLQPIPQTTQLGIGLDNGGFGTYDTTTMGHVHKWQLGDQSILAGSEGPYGSVFLSKTGRAVSNIDTRSPEAYTFTMAGEVCALAHDPQHRFLAVSDKAQNVFLWDHRKINTPFLQLRTTSVIKTLTFQSSTLIAGGKNGSLSIFCPCNGSVSMTTMEAGGSFSYLRTLPENHLLSCRLLDEGIKLQILKLHLDDDRFAVTEVKDLMTGIDLHIDRCFLRHTMYTSVNDSHTQVVTGIPAASEQEVLTLHTLPEVKPHTKKVKSSSFLTSHQIR